MSDKVCQLIEVYLPISIENFRTVYEEVSHKFYLEVPHNLTHNYRQRTLLYFVVLHTCQIAKQPNKMTLAKIRFDMNKIVAAFITEDSWCVMLKACCGNT